MKLFDKFKKKEESVNWDNAYKANPRVYSKPGSDPFCVFALTEGTETILPQAPHFAVYGKEIKEYNLMLVSTTKDGVLGDCDYFEAIRKLESFKLDSDDKNILIKGLSLSELEGILR